jgi:hypothetical protein
MQFFAADVLAASRMGRHARQFIEDNQPHEQDIYSTILRHESKSENNVYK